MLQSLRLGIIVLICVGTANAGLTVNAKPNAPTTQPVYDYTPGVDQVMNELRNLSTRDSAERIMRSFPEEAISIARQELSEEFKDLPPETRTAASDILDQNLKARAHFKEVADADRRWNMQSAQDLYKNYGNHDPKWDETALAAIFTFVQNKPDYDLFDKAKSQGCNNPLFVYFSLRALSMKKDHPALTRELDDTVDLLIADGYPASRKCFGLAYSARGHLPDYGKSLDEDDRKYIEDRLDKALAAFPDVVKETMHPLTLSQLADLLQDDYFRLYGDRLKALDKVYPVISAALPDSTIPLDLKGRTYIDSAWDARGSGWANTITDKGEILMEERLKIARHLLVQACNKDPFDYFAATQMINVTLGDGSGKDEMENWFRKAVEAYPDYLLTYKAKMNFLEPKWYGTPEEMIAFGRECLATQNFRAGIPMQIAAAHSALSQYIGKDYSTSPIPDYFRNLAPTPWNDICAAYIPTLKLYPKDYFDRSSFARLAVWCQHYDEADRQFKILGDNVDVSAFQSQTELYELRGEAIIHAADQTKQ